VSIVVAGADEYFCVFTVVLVLAGQPALTATSFAWACSLASVPVAATVVVVVLSLDFEAALLLLLLPPETRKTIPTITPTTTTAMMPLRICLRRFWL